MGGSTQRSRRSTVMTTSPARKPSTDLWAISRRARRPGWRHGGRGASEMSRTRATSHTSTRRTSSSTTSWVGSTTDIPPRSGRTLRGVQPYNGLGGTVLLFRRWRYPGILYDWRWRFWDQENTRLHV